MNIALEAAQKLISVYRPAFEYSRQSFLPYDLGLITPKPLNDYGQLKYIVQKNPGGLLKIRKPGESIPVRSTGLDVDVETVESYSFSDSVQTGIHEIYGLKDPLQLNPETVLSIQSVYTQHFDDLFTKLSNTMRLWSSLALVPSVTIDGTVFNNDKILQIDASANPWSTNTTDILGYLLDLMANWHGSGLSVPSITVLVRNKQVQQIIKNQTVQKTVGFDKGIGLTPSAVMWPAVQATFAGFGINLYKWDDFYTSVHNSGAYQNQTAFLPEDYITVIPGAYFNRIPSNLNQLQQVSPQSNGSAPFVDLFVGPDPEFANKPKSRSPLEINGALNGAYFYTGFPTTIDPTKPDVYQSALAAKMALYIADGINIKYIKVN